MLVRLYYIGLMLLSPLAVETARAEVFTKRFKDWSYIWTDNAQANDKCLVGTASQTGEFRVMFSRDVGLSLQVKLKGLSLTPGTPYRIGFSVDERAWRDVSAQFNGSDLRIALRDWQAGTQLLGAIIDGKELRLHGNLGAPRAVWSLRGSAKAAEKLRACVRDATQQGEG